MIMKYVFTLLVCSAVYLFAGTASAATISAVASSSQGTGMTFPVHIYIESKDSLNSLSGTLLVPKGIAITGIDDSRSVISLWIERPTVTTVGESQVVSFSGIIPGGYVGKTELFTFTGEAKDRGSATLSFKNVEAFQNDADATAIPVDSAALTLRIESGGTSEVATSPEDHIQPEPFTPIISKDALIEDGKWFVVFNVHDKQSGIDHVEVYERKKFLGLFKSETGWVTATSPHILKDQERKSQVSVKAVDRAGNERIVTLEKAGTSTGELYLKYGLLGILVLLLCLVFLYFI